MGSKTILGEYIDEGQAVQNQVDAELFAILPVVEQVRTLHAKGQYGFDICPQNIVMTRRGAQLRVRNIALSPNGASIYRPGYSPRERYMGGALGPWTDVYAISSLVYTAMTGLLLPSSFERGKAEPLFCGLNEKYRELEDAVAQGLSPEASARPRSLDALSVQIRDCLIGYAPAEKRKPKKAPGRKRMIAAVVISALLLLSGAVLVNEINYSQADAHAKAGEFELAQNSLKGVFSFYKDAQQLNDYAGAGKRLASGDYAAAAQDFTALGEYRDSKDMFKETAYRHARALNEQGKLPEAEQLLQTIKEYKDAGSLLKQISYQIGGMYREAGLYLSALQAYTNAEVYADASAMAAQMKGKLYEAGLVAITKGDAKTAAQYFAAIPGYEKADELNQLTALLVRVESGDAISQDEYGFIMGFADWVDLSAYADALTGY